MEFTKLEKDTLTTILKRHLEELKRVEKLPNDNAGEFMTEVEYGALIRGIIKQLA